MTTLVASVARQAPGTITRNLLNVFSPAAMIEVHDNFFHHNSAVMMPDCDPHQGPAPPTPPPQPDAEYLADLREYAPEHLDRFDDGVPPVSDEDAPDRVSGLGVLVVAYRFQTLNPDYLLLLAGHADTSGDDSYNFDLSRLRAKNVLHLLLGERGPWVDISERHSQVEDYQRILKHYAREFRWDCDPGDVDNQRGPQTEAAVANFQATYNTMLDKSIAVDGDVGSDTWGAFFDMYMEELALMLDTTPAELEASRRVQLLSTDAPLIACGEQMPIDHPERPDYRSSVNRRVELLFFHRSYRPDLRCHASTTPFCMKACPRSACGVYGHERFEYVHILPRPLRGRYVGEYTPRFETRAIDVDLANVPDGPNESYGGSMQTSVVLPDDPWAFLEPFAALEPQEGSNEVDQGIASTHATRV